MSDELPECLKPKPANTRTQLLLAGLKKMAIEKAITSQSDVGGDSNSYSWDTRDKFFKGQKILGQRDTAYAAPIIEKFKNEIKPTVNFERHDKLLLQQREFNYNRGEGDDDDEGEYYDEEGVDNEHKDRFRGNETISGLDFFVDSTKPTMLDIEAVSTIAEPPETARSNSNPSSYDMSEIISKYFNEANRRNKTHQTLPITNLRSKITPAIGAYNVVVVQGNTGSGKSTQVPQFILEDAILTKKQPANIFCTQPRKIAARSVAQRVCQENGWELGSLVGYQVGLDNKNRSPDTMLTYCTTGVLVERIIAEKSLKNYTHIIVDEVHERDVDTDMLLMLIRWYMKIELHPNFSLIIMSATMDVQKILTYFHFKLAFGHENSSQSLAIKVNQPSKAQYDAYFLECLSTYDRDRTLGSIPEFEIDTPELKDYCVAASVFLITNMFERIDGDRPLAVLVFLPGLGEINHLDSQLRKSNTKLDIRQLHSSLPSEEQNRVFEPAIGGKRKVILSTNIAESSITLPDIGYVVDFCLSKAVIKDERTRFPMLQLQWASKDRCVQRAGRAGRVINGKVFRLLPEHFYEQQLPQYAQPELLTAPLENTILRTKKSNIASPIEQLGLMLDPPQLKDIRSAIIELKQIGALTVKMNGKLNREDGDITELGLVICHLPIDVHLSKLIVMGYVFDCLDDCIILAACMSGRGIIRSSYSDELGDFKKRISWSKGSFSDLFIYLEAYKAYTMHAQKSKTFLRKFCENEHLDLKKLMEVDILYEELKIRLTRLNIFVDDQPNRVRNIDQDELMLKFTFCAAFYPNFFVSKSIDENVVTRMFHDSDPSRSVYLEGIPREQGPIYKNQIESEFEAISVKPDILFSGTRAVITFNDCDAPLGKVNEENFIIRKSKGFVHESVYLALKLGMCRGVAIREFNHVEARKRIEYYDNRWKAKKDASNTLTSTRIKLVDSNQNIRLKKVNWVPISLNSMILRIMNIEDCCHFFARWDEDRVRQYAHDISDMINEDILECSAISKQMIGSIAFARHPKYMGKSSSGRSVLEGFHRIEVRSEPSIQRRRVMVYFYDFGLTCQVPEEDIYVIRREFRDRLKTICDIPVLAIECRIQSIKPAPWATLWAGWSDEAKLDFKDKLLSPRLDQRFEAKIYSNCDSVVHLDIFSNGIKDSSCDSTSIRQRLITLGHGVAVEEPKVSMDDNKKRQDYINAINAANNTADHAIADNFREALLESQNDQAFCEIERDAANDEYDLEELNKLVGSRARDVRNFGRVRHQEYAITNEENPSSLFKSCYTKLKGPSSPITLSFQGMSAKSSKTTVAIERDSINSVSVDADYLDKRYQLMIAGSITISQSGRLQARDTTLMPKIHGLPTIISLLFAPYYEFRANPALGCLAGALFGLGCDDNGRPIDHENDMEIDFDCLITRSDIEDINTCRKIITELISKLHIQNSNEPTGQLQRGLRLNIMKLIRQRRLPIKQYLQETFAQWVGIDKSCVNTVKPTGYLPIIQCPLLDDNEIYSRLEQNFKYIEDLVENRQTLTISGVRCLLCDSGQGTNYIGRTDLRHHLESSRHLSRRLEFDTFLGFRNQK